MTKKTLFIVHIYSVFTLFVPHTELRAKNMDQKLEALTYAITYV